VIGRIGLYEIDAQNRCASIGYWLDKEYEGRGIITESCKLLIDYAYTSLPVNRIEIRCATNNLRSKNIPIKLGFKLDGILRSGEFIHHSFHDLYNFSMLKNEWK
jgi:ribosomal-protein-serine acetyltransferase